MTQGAYDSGTWPPLPKADEGSSVSEIKEVQAAREGSTVAGRQRLGRYQLLKRIAVGGMAEIFLARATGIEGFEKLVVLKRILPRYAQDFRFVRMFLQEARLAATLHHANIVQVYDIGRSGPTYFFTMEYVHGADLRHLWNAAMQTGQRIPIEQAISIAIGLAAGLHYAHERNDQHGRPLGIVHRDISPSNVLVDYDGCVKIVDFGIAKASSQKSDTQPGRIRGKVSYMSPEQCLGRPLDRRSDIFSLGILLYELSTGRRLFEATSEHLVLSRILHDNIAPPRAHDASFPEEMERILYRALARDPRERYATARELQLDLEAFARERRLVVSPVSLAEYVEGLVGQNVDAWREAQNAGKSLLEHVTEGIKSDRSAGALLSASDRRAQNRDAPDDLRRVDDAEFETIDTMALEIELDHASDSSGPLGPNRTEPGHALVKWEQQKPTDEPGMRSRGHAIDAVRVAMVVAEAAENGAPQPASLRGNPWPWRSPRLAIVLGIGAVAAAGLYLGLPTPPKTPPLLLEERSRVDPTLELLPVAPPAQVRPHQAALIEDRSADRAVEPADTASPTAPRALKRKGRARAHRAIRFADEGAAVPSGTAGPSAIDPPAGNTSPQAVPVTAPAPAPTPTRGEKKTNLDHDTLMLPGQSEE